MDILVNNSFRISQKSSSYKMVSCASCGCTRNKKQKQDGVTFHMFPTDERRRVAWIHFMNDTEFVPKTQSFLCSRHFADDCFDRTSKVKVRLQPNALPTIIVDRLKYKKNYAIVYRPSKCVESSLMDHDYVYSINGASGIAGPSSTSEPSYIPREQTPPSCDEIPPIKSIDTPRERVLKQRIEKLEHREFLYLNKIKHLQKINWSLKQKLIKYKTQKKNAHPTKTSK
ncbi:THAP domain-containing protein 1-like [Harmonia axyridis]|uniref:THAP domain-containing protein 1-like n=1 Tax=Harmonia axyridis TaxID=115357 RepID=UPI001E277B3B|nr:THAP domain-containing protein 1-like [Harmonia axyridis]